MAKGYILVFIKRTRPDGWDEYRRGVTELVAEFGGRYVVQGGTVEVLEGSFDGRQMVVLEFPSMETVRAFWNSPAYGRLKALRSNSGVMDAWAVAGV
ncbi:MAG: DUF1330 domain-containing protein [Burkholderiales bacterium]|nr:DUF1330 domain-containing protein [Burkholderiales bacterium]